MRQVCCPCCRFVQPEDGLANFPVLLVGGRRSSTVTAFKVHVDLGMWRHFLLSRWSHYREQLPGRLKIEKKCCLFLDIFSIVKIKVFHPLSLSGSRCISDAIITVTQLEQRGEIFWDSRCCLCAWVYAF